VVAAGQGALFPVAPFNATVWPAGVQPASTNAEIVRVTARTVDTLTITRAQEGTAARSIVVGDQVANTITKKVLTDAETVSYVHVRDEKAQFTGGGTFTSSAWRTRDLNTEASDTEGLCTLASNQITLVAGTYECWIACPAWNVGRNQARLQNVTDATQLLLGNCLYSVNAMTLSVVAGRFTVAASKAIEVQHWGETTVADLGFGVETRIGTEVYTVAEFWRRG